jgi:MFS family permease
MTTQAAAAGAAHAAYNPARLFLISCLALATGALVFSLFANIMAPLAAQFRLPAEQIGLAAGNWGLGMAFAVFVGSAALDTLGMGRVLGLACLLQIIGVGVTLATPSLQSAVAPLLTLTIGQLILGVGHGLIEAAINPLAATVYPEDKTHRLNVLHAWWPGGLVIGGLLGFFMTQSQVGWQIQYGIILLPAAIYGLMLIGQPFPPTERKAAGVPTGEMWKQALRPLYIVWWLCMLLTAALELGPGRWVQAMLTDTVQMQGILLLVYISALMFVMRHFAGPLAHKLSPVGLMWVSSLVAGIGLFALSWATSPILALLASTLWGVGVCYMWPTMLGVTSERFPRGGAVLLGLTGTAGMLSQFFVVPLMGRIYDTYTQLALDRQGLRLEQVIADTAPAMQAALQAARTEAAPYAFRYISAAAIVLIVVFGVIWMRDRASGGYQAERIAPEEVELGQADPGSFSAEAILAAEAAGPDTHPAVDFSTVVAETVGPAASEDAPTAESAAEPVEGERRA